MNKRTQVGLAAIALVIGMGSATAKEWKSEVVTIKDGKLTLIETVASCNYASTVSKARKVADKHEGAYINLVSTDNEATCPKRKRTAKADAAK